MFKERSYKKELLDGDHIPEEDLYQNLKELDVINNLLGGYSMTFSALKKVLKKGVKSTIVDIGCGGGDTLKRIFEWNIKENYDVQLYGIDLKQTCIHYANTNNSKKEIKFICDDYRNINKHLPKVDVIHACLFCHHLADNEIVELIKFAQKNKSTLIINDLERNAIAYYSIKLLTRIFSKSYLVKNDAPLSVLRGFKRNEWEKLIKTSEATNYKIKYKWAFRYEVIVYAD
ncbi:MAG: methyltransferase domain-containing protein [Bacteroidetes bacterium]|jgi:2-polyprenyl-3-methyl-5-hydroxy-6-metoxy-1,4-benzoquinol methylase|nr:methyltransferase domain-containing protein [Bacteroidota bacterium]MCA6443114.1 methyltransferase domain-containing protein [Bacteroidota bacterium]